MKKLLLFTVSIIFCSNVFATNSDSLATDTLVTSVSIDKLKEGEKIYFNTMGVCFGSDFKKLAPGLYIEVGRKKRKLIFKHANL